MSNTWLIKQTEEGVELYFAGQEVNEVTGLEVSRGSENQIPTLTIEVGLVKGSSAYISKERGYREHVKFPGDSRPLSVVRDGSGISRISRKYSDSEISEFSDYANELVMFARRNTPAGDCGEVADKLWDDLSKKIKDMKDE